MLTPTAPPPRYPVHHGYAPERPARERPWIDFVAYASISILAIFWIASYQRVPEYGTESSCYVGLAQSLKLHKTYQFNYVPHVNYPPGFPVFLLLLSALYGREPVDSYPVFMPSIALCGALTLLAGYRLIRGYAPPGWALLFVALVGSSPFMFDFSTRYLGSDLPYSLASLAALLAFDRIRKKADAASAERVGVWYVLFALCMIAALAMRAIGTALCAALCLWSVVSWVRTGRRPPAALLVLIFLGILEQAAWFGWTKMNYVPIASGETSYDYGDDFLRKDPNQPDLGQATPWDFIARPVWRLGQETSHVTEYFFLNRWLEPAVSSPLIAIPAALMILGVVTSLLSKVPPLPAFYFAAYAAILLVWPYDQGPRYLFPVLPLCFVYLYVGWDRCREITRTQRDRFLIWIVLGSAVLLTVALYATVIARQRGLQIRLAAPFWAVVLAAALWARFRPAGARLTTAAARVRPVLRPAAYLYVAVMCLLGLQGQAQAARANLTIRESDMLHYPSAEAARWLRDHTAPDAVIMSFNSWLIHSISGRRIIPFPPTGRPERIVDVARKYGAQYLIVGHDTWYVPTQEERLRILMNAYPDGVEPVVATDRFRVFRLTKLLQ